MKPFAFYSILAIGMIIVVGVIWWGLHKHAHALQSSSPAATSTAATSTPPLTGLSIYTNGEYGFSIYYPDSMKAEKTFDTQYLLPASWRVDALPNATGTPIIEILGYQTTSTDSYPRYFETQVRVGASADPSELAACTQPSSGETALPNVTLNGTTWHAFSFQDQAMMNSLQGVSYRTVHDGMCYALEQIETGSTYRDDPPSSADIPQATLDQQYANLDAVVKSFTFAHS